MAEVLTPDICVIGAGSGGLSVAVAMVQMGAEVVLVEKGKMGGDCLNTGCVPSKSLLASAHQAHALKSLTDFGFENISQDVDMKKIHDRIHRVIGKIAPHDSQKRMESLGIQIIRAKGQFVDTQTLKAGQKFIRAKRFVLATGSSPIIPPIDGLKDVPYFTNETIFDNQEFLPHLIVIGGGPIGLEMAQAHARLGSNVTIVARSQILPKDDPEAVEIIRQSLIEEGLDVREATHVIQVKKNRKRLEVVVETNGVTETLVGSHILVATGRKPNVSDLDLEAASIDYTPRGVKTNSKLQTTNKRVYGVGDVIGSPYFTHLANYHAGVVIRNFLSPIKTSVDMKALPWVTYTDPEIAHVGLSESDARKGRYSHRVLTWPFEGNDRAQAEGKTQGLLKAIVSPRGKILGCTIVGPHAGELLQPWCLGVQKGLNIKDFASMIVPYPTLSEITKRAAGSFYTPKLFSKTARLWTRIMMALKR